MVIWELESLVYFTSSQRRNVIQILFEALKFIKFHFYDILQSWLIVPTLLVLNLEQESLKFLDKKSNFKYGEFSLLIYTDLK